MDRREGEETVSPIVIAGQFQGPLQKSLRGKGVGFQIIIIIVSFFPPTTLYQLGII